MPAKDNLLSIKDAADFLDVSKKTLRRWEKKGYIIPLRTSGGHRRYSLAKLKAFKKRGKKKSKRKPKVSKPLPEATKRHEAPDTDKATLVKPKKEFPVSPDDLSFLYKSLPKIHKKVVFAGLAGLVLLSALVGVKKAPIEKLVKNTPLNKVASFVSEQKPEGIEKLKKQVQKGEVPARVLPATSFDSVSFNVNVESFFNRDTNVAGTLNLTGNTLTSADDLSITPGGGGVSVGAGTPANIDLEDGDLFVTDELEIGGDFFADNATLAGDASIAGDTAVGTLTINAETFTDLTGTGLVISDGSLETSIGDTIESAEIADGTILEVDLSATNDPADDQLLSYDSSSGGFTWVAEAASLFTDGGTVAYLTQTTDSLTVGSTSELAKIAADGDADEVQLLAQGNSTQTSDIFVVEQSDGTDIFSVGNSGNTTLTNSGSSNIVFDLTSSGDFIIQDSSSTFATFSDNGLFSVDNLQMDGNTFSSSTGNLILSPSSDLVFSGFDCSSFDNGGALTANASGVITCTNDDGGGTSPGWEDDGQTVRLTTSTDFVAIGANTADGKVGITGSRTGQALLVLDEEGDQNILTASASGTTVANLDRSGNLEIEGSISDLSGTVLTVDDDLQVNGNDILDSGATSRITLGSTTTLTNSTLVLSGTSTLTASSLTDLDCSDCIDFDDMADSLTLDAATTITNGLSGNLDIDLTSTGDFTVSDAGTPYATFTDDGVFTLDSLNLDGTTIGLTTDTDLLSLANDALTVNGSVTTTGDLAVNGGDITTTATTFNLDVADTGTIQFRDGTNVLSSIRDGGSNGIFFLSTTGTQPGTCTEGEVYTDSSDNSIYYCEGGNSWVDLTNSGGNVSGSGASGQVTFWTGASNVSGNNNFYWDNTGELFGIGVGTSPVHKLHLTGAVTGKALAVLDETGDQNILSASASGTTVANLDRSGNLAIDGTISDLNDTTLVVDDDLQVNGNDILDSGAISRITLGSTTTLTNSQLTLSGTTTVAGTSVTSLNLGAATVDFDGAGTLQYADGSDFTVRDDGGNNILALTGTTDLIEFGNATDNNAFTFLGTGQVTFNGNVDTTSGLDVTGASLTVGGNATVTTAGAGTFTQVDADNLRLDGNTLSSTSGDITIDSAGGDVFFADTDVFAIGGHAGGVAYNVISDSGGSPSSGQLDSDDDLFVEGTLEAGAVYQGANQVCDTSGNCAGSTNYWQLSSGSISPGNAAGDSDKVVLGGNDTTDFQFEVNGTQAGKALVSLNDTGTDQNILTASASGTTVANLDRSGNLAIEGQLSDLSGATLTINDALSVLGSATVDDLTTDTGGVSIAAGQSYTGAGAVTLDAGGANQITIGSGDVTQVVFTTDGTGDSEVQLPGQSIGASEIVNDSLDFAQFADSMTLDASTSIGFGASTFNFTFTNDGSGNEIHNLTSTGDFVIQDAGTNFVTFADDSSITFAPQSTADATFTLDSDSTLILTGVQSGTGDSVCLDGSNNVVTCAAGGGSSPWTLSGSILYPDQTTYQVGIGTTTDADVISQFYVTNGSTLGKALAIFNQTENQEILTASASGTTVARLSRSGELFLNTTTANADVFEIQGNSTGSNTFTGTATIADLTANRTWTFPDDTGDVCLSSGNCSGTSGGSKWTDSNGTTYLTDTTDDLVVGGTSSLSGAKISFDGDEDEVQVVIRGHSTQTANLLNLENDAGTALAHFDESGNLRLGSSAPDTGKLNTTGAFTGKALAIFDETGDQNILTASASGTTVFNLTRAGGLEVAAGEGIDTLSAGTLDLGVTNANAVSIAGTGVTTTVNGALTISEALTANGSFTLGDNGDTGSIDTSDWDISTTGDMTGIGAITADGAISFTPGGTDDITFNVDTDSLFTLDSTVANADNLAISPNNDGTGSTFTGTITSANLTADRTWTLPDDTGTVCLTTGNCAGTTTNWELTTNSISPGNAADDSDKVVLGGNDTTDFQLEVNGTQAGKALVSLNDTGTDQNILTASASGTTVFNLTRDGTLQVAAGEGIDTLSAGALNIGTTNATSAVIGSGSLGSLTVTTDGTGDSEVVLPDQSISASEVLNDTLDFAQFADSMTLDAATTITNSLSGDLDIDLTSTGDFTISDSGTPFATFTDGGVFTLDNLQLDGNTLSSTSGDITLSSAGNDVFLTDTDVLVIGGHAGGVAYNVISDSGGSPSSGQLDSDDDLFIEGTLEAGALYQGANQVCDTSGNCAGSTNYWAVNGNVLYPGNAANDGSQVVIGLGRTDTEFQFEVQDAVTGKALVVLDEEGDQNILSASASGTTVANLDRSGNLAIDGTISDLNDTTLVVDDDLQINGGDLTTNQTTFNLINTTATTLNLGGAATTLNIADAAITGTIDIGGVDADGATTVNIATNSTSGDTITIGNSNTSTTLALTGGDDWSVTAAGVATFSQLDVDNLRMDANTLSATSGDINLDAAGGDIIFADTDTLNIGGSGSQVAYNVIADSIAGASGDMDSDNDLYIEGNLEVDGTINSATFAGPFSEGSVIFVNSSSELTEDNDNFFWNDSADKLGLGDNTPDGKLEVSGAVVGKALVILNEAGDQNILTASASGTTQFNLTRAGTVETGDLTLGLDDTSATIATNDTDEDLTLNPNGAGDVYFHGSTYNISDTGDLTIGGRVTFENSEFIGNETDDLITFTGAGGADNTDLYLDLDGTYPLLYSNTDTQIGIDDDLIFEGAQTITTSTGDLTIDTAGTLIISDATDINNTLDIGGDITFDATTPTISINDTETLTINDGTNTLLTLADAGTTGNLTLSGNLDVDGSSNDIAGTLNLSGNTLTSSGDLTINPTGQDVTIDGDLILNDTFTLQVGGLTGTAYNAFANSSEAPEQADIDADNDLYIGGSLEVDGSIYQGDSQVCDTSGNCAGSTNFWELSTNSISPGNAAADTDKLVIGGNDTTDFQFEVNGAQVGKALVSLNETGDQNILTASASGTTRMVLTNAGRLGVGTTSPQSLLHVDETTGGIITIGRDDTTVSSGETVGTLSFYSNDSDFGDREVAFISAIADNNASNNNWARLDFGNEQNTILTLRDPSNNNAQVGISITSPQAELHLNRDASNSGPNLMFTNDDTGDTSSDGFSIGIDGSEIATLIQRENFAMTFSTNDTERARISAEGLFGISNNSPVGLLDVDGAVTGKALTIFNETGDQNILTASASGTTVFNLQRDGDLDVYGTSIGLNNDASANNVLTFGAIAGGDAGSDLYWGQDLVCDVSETDCGWATAAGSSNFWQLNSNVIAPGTDATVTDRVVLGGNTDTDFQFEVNGAQVGKALVSLNETGDQDIFTASSSGTTRFRISNSGHVLPGADDTYDLGSSTLRWRDLYTGPNSIHFGTDGNEAILGYDTTNNWIELDPDGNGTEDARLDDNGQLALINDGSTAGLTVGAGGDLALYHDGTDSFITNATNDLFIAADDDSAGSQLQFGLEDGTTVLGYFITGTTNQGDFVIDTDTFYVDVSSDEVGIGDITNPRSQLHIHKETPGAHDLRITNATTTQSGGVQFELGQDEQLRIRNLSNTHMTFETNDTERARISADGRFGVSNNSPVGLLDVDGAVTGKAMAIFNETGDQNILTASASGTNVLNINRSGDILADGVFSFGDSTPDGNAYNTIGTGDADDGSITDSSDLYITGDLEVDGTVVDAGSATITASDFSCTDCLDFTEFEDTLDLDAATEINLGASNLTFDLDSTGVLAIADAGTTYWSFNDDSTVDVTFPATGKITIDASTTDNTTTGGIIDINTDTTANDAVGGLSLTMRSVADAQNDTIYGNFTDIRLNNDGSANDTVYGEYIDLTVSDSGGTAYGLRIGANDGGGDPVTAGLLIENLQSTDIDLTDAILIQATTDGSMPDAIDVSDAEITNAINLGNNNLVLAGDTINDFSGNGLEVSTNALTVDLLDSSDGTGGTASFSGLEFQGAGSDELTLLQGCSDGQILKWDDVTDVRWECQDDAGGSGVSGTGATNQVAFWTASDTISGNNNFYWDNTAETLGIGTSGSNTHKLEVTGAVVGKALAALNETGDQNILTASASGTTRMYLSNGGNLVIGTGATTQHSINQDGSVVFNEQGNDADLRIEGDTEQNLLFADASTNRVGFGTNSPGGIVSALSTTANSSIFAITDALSSSPLQIVNFKYNTGTNLGRIMGVEINSNSVFYLQGTASRPIAFAGGAATTPHMLIDTSGRVGIGNTSPVGLLDVNGAVTGKALAIFNETGDQSVLTASASGTTRLNLTNDGQLELPTDGSTAGLTIGAGGDLALYHDGTDSFITNATNDLFLAADDDSAGSQLQFGLEDGTSVLGYFITGTTNQGDFVVDTDTLYVDASQNEVGINVTVPRTILHTHLDGPNDNTIKMTNASTGLNNGVEFGLGADEELLIHNFENTPITFLTTPSGEGSSEKLRISSEGLVGIGNNSPVGLLDVDGAVTGKALTILNETGDQDIFTASASGTTAFRISNSRGTFLDLPGTGTGNALCHTTASGTDDEEIVDCTSTPAADYMEMYPTESGIQTGDLVAIGQNSTITTDNERISKLTKTSNPYQSNVIGIVSNPEKASDFNSIGYNIRPEDNPMPVALSGRVPVKVSSSSDSINPGDYMTTSSEAGRAMKAGKAGKVIGTALESWTPGSGKDTVMIFVDNAYHEPNLALNNLGNFSLEKTGSTNPDNKYELTNSEGDAIDRITAFANVIAANIRAGYVEVKELSATAKAEIALLISPSIRTQEIAPLDGEGDVAIKIGSSGNSSTSSSTGESGFGKLLVQNQDGETVFGVDEQGNATASGEIASESLKTNEASIAGTLRADKIEAKEIVGLDAKIADISTNRVTGITREEIEELLKEAESDQTLLSDSSSWETNTATGSASLNEAVLENLYVTNAAALNSLSVSESVVIGNDLTISSQQSIVNGQSSIVNSIDSISAPLSLQSSASQPLHIMGGLVAIDTNGNVQIAGDLAVAGRIESSGITLRSTRDETGTEQENTGSGFGKLLSIANEEGLEVASITASGSARFASLTTDRVAFADDPEATTSATFDGLVYETSATAGTARVPSGSRDVIIRNAQIKEGSLIFVTPTSSTISNLYIKEQLEGEARVGFDSPVAEDVNFNWWLVELVSSSQSQPR